jgi:hypothetical protein
VLAFQLVFTFEHRTEPEHEPSTEKREAERRVSARGEPAVIANWQLVAFALP